MDASTAQHQHLRDRHNRLEKAIAAEMKHPIPDFVQLQTLKKEKLVVKQRLEHIT